MCRSCDRIVCSRCARSTQDQRCWNGTAKNARKKWVGIIGWGASQSNSQQGLHWTPPLKTAVQILAKDEKTSESRRCCDKSIERWWRREWKPESRHIKHCFSLLFTQRSQWSSEICKRYKSATYVCFYVFRHLLRIVFALLQSESSISTKCTHLTCRMTIETPSWFHQFFFFLRENIFLQFQKINGSTLSQTSGVVLLPSRTKLVELVEQFMLSVVAQCLEQIIFLQKEILAMQKWVFREDTQFQLLIK